MPNTKEPHAGPSWVRSLTEIFLAGTTSTFVLHGNVHDLVEQKRPEGERTYLSLKRYLERALFPRFDCVAHYDRGTGLRFTFPSGDPELQSFTQGLLRSAGTARITPPRLALELIDRVMHHAIYVSRPPRKLAVIVRYAELIAPASDVSSLPSEAAESVIRLAAWAEDPTISGQNVVVLLVSERASDLNRMVLGSPHVEKVAIPLPGAAEVEAYLEWLADEEPSIRELSDVTTHVMAKRLVGLNRVDVRDGILRETRNGRRVTDKSLRRAKKALMEAECGQLLELIESKRTLDLVAGHTAAKKWLRQDMELLRRGKSHALPMGYLLCGRIGTGKTFLVTCWAGELGIPCVVLKNFRDRWVGATEGNLEKIFTVLEALGQCLVFVDEADQFAGKRGGGSGDSGLSGRVYAKLAQEMSKTENRGRIIWVFATSRPDLLEVDLKRQGRLDVHIPLFPPDNQKERDALLHALIRKLKVPLAPGELPTMPAGTSLGGNEIEGALVRALRLWELEPAEGEGSEPRRSFADILVDVFADMRASGDQRRLRYMDLIAVKECTDTSFLPERFRHLEPDQVDRAIGMLDAGLDPDLPE
ncbi:MAG: ATP-binding protein [Planctomycetota bacterium]|jgi:hypothetical protein